jgi:hypothetical protein
MLFISKGNKISILKRPLHLMFITALFIIVKIWKQTKCSSMDKENVEK